MNKDEYQDLLSDLGYPAMDTSVYNANIDWQDEMFRNAAMQNYQLSISGGNENPFITFQPDLSNRMVL